MKKFKLIGLRPLEKCNLSILKVLKKNTTYFLCNEYEIDSNDNNKIKLKENYSSIPDGFFDDGNIDSPKINISAIVGKNGDGKSSIVELIIRILNNFAYYSGFRENHPDLIPIDGVEAILYYSIGDIIYSLKVTSDRVELDKDKKDEKFPIVFSENSGNQIKIKKLKNELFFSQISNYSLYAYNSNDFEKNDLYPKCWIDKIFHKNDGYQTPIVLTPYRKEGNIDVNLENYLSIQRLISLFVEDANDNNSIRDINQNQKANYLAFFAYPESKLESQTYKALFDKTYNDYLKLFIDQTKLFNKKYTETEKRLLFKSINSLIKNNKEDFDFVLNIIGTSDNTSETDYYNFFKEFDHISDSLISNNCLSNYKNLNFAVIQRVIFVIYIKEFLNKKYDNEYTSGKLYNDAFSNAKQYIIYKIISIFSKYPLYKINNIANENPLLLFDVTAKKTIEESLERLFEDIDKEKSHISLKLRQTLNYIKYESKYIKEEDKKNIAFEKIKDVVKNYGNNLYIIEFNEYLKRIKQLINEEQGLNILELLPPPIFKTEVVLEENKTNQCTLLSQMSSGERQYLYSISSVIYHLQNINSVKDELVKYKYVNLIFEEIELYFHPEYQRKFINSLLQQIQKAKFKDIDSINLCFVTHSPFILSDIPKNNVLFLKNGMPVREMQEDTFGANIHTLLQNSFFLNSVPIGEFAKNRINSMFDELHNWDRLKSSEEKENKLYQQIRLVSEPFIKTQLLKLYNENISQSCESKSLKDKIQELEQMINELKITTK